MSGLDEVLLAEKAAAIERHLARVEARRPARAEELRAGSDASDAVILHLWQAVQIAIDLGVAAHVRAGLGSPAYGDAFRGLARAGIPRTVAARCACRERASRDGAPRARPLTRPTTSGSRRARSLGAHRRSRPRASDRQSSAR